MHDASYYSLAEIKGLEMLLVTMLEMCCDPQGPGPGSKQYVNILACSLILFYIRRRCLGGSRVLETHLYKLDSYPFDLIGPIAIIWQPLPQSSIEKSASSNVRSSTSKKKKKKKELPEVLPASGPMTSRSIWLLFHPSVQLEVFDTLKQAASRTLAKYKIDSINPQEATLEIADLTTHVNMFEIMGPKASQVIKGALSPVASENRKEFLKVSSNFIILQYECTMAQL